MYRWLTLLGLLAQVACQANIRLGGSTVSSTQATGGSSTLGGSVNPSTCVPQASAAPLQRLSALQYTNSVKDLLGLASLPQLTLPTDDTVGPFPINTTTGVSDLAASEYQSAAETLAAQVGPQLNVSAKTSGCAAAAADANCVSAFVASFGARVFRRPLTSDEIARYATLAAPYLANQDANNAVRIVVQGLLQSPYFLYRPEFGTTVVASPNTVALSSYELASRLSYFLWNSTPDATLQQAATGNLQDTNAYQAQVQRMIASPRFGQSMGAFVTSLLGTGSLSTVTKDPNAFPSYSPALAAAMAQETADFTNYVLQQGDGSFATLMTAPYSVLTDPLFAYYGVSKPTGWKAGDIVQLDPNERAGFLTQGAFLTVQAHFSATGVVARGKTLRENFLCQAMPPPPPNVPSLPSNTTGQQTARQMFANHVSSPSCASCHDLMDPMGLSFEHYDGIGAWRATDHGLAIDASGALTGTSQSNGNFSDALTLATLLAGSNDVQLCLATQMARFSLQREETSTDACSIAQYAKSLAAHHGDVRALAQDIANSTAFVNYSSP